MTFLPNVLPPPKKARPSRCPSNQENAPLPNMALLPIGENMGKSRHIVHSWSVGSTIYVHPALQHFLLAFSGPIILSNTNCLYENLGEHDMDIACSAQRFGLGIFCPKVLAVFKTTCDWCLWLVNYVYVLAASNQTQISIYIYYMYIHNTHLHTDLGTWFQTQIFQLQKQHENKKTTLNPLLRCHSLWWIGSKHLVSCISFCSNVNGPIFSFCAEWFFCASGWGTGKYTYICIYTQKSKQ